MSRRSVNYKKERLLEYEICSQLSKMTRNVETSTDDIFKNNNPSANNNHLLDKIRTKIEKLEQWEVTKTALLERLSLLIDVIKAKQIEIRRKEMELLQKMSFRRPSVEIEERFSTNDGSIVKASRKRKLKNTIKRYQSVKRIKISSEDENLESDLVEIGPNGTTVPKLVLKSIDWQSTTSATRGLLMAIFDRETLAFRTLSGKKSPAFADCDIPVKDQLDPLKVADIIYIVTKYCKVPERDVKMAITTKCADENKMFKQREKRKSLLQK